MVIEPRFWHEYVFAQPFFVGWSTTDFVLNTGGVREMNLTTPMILETDIDISF